MDKKGERGWLPLQKKTDFRIELASNLKEFILNHRKESNNIPIKLLQRCFCH